jgi:hypothetical protein
MSKQFVFCEVQKTSRGVAKRLRQTSPRPCHLKFICPCRVVRSDERKPRRRNTIGNHRRRCPFRENLARHSVLVITLKSHPDRRTARPVKPTTSAAFRAPFAHAGDVGDGGPNYGDGSSNRDMLDSAAEFRHSTTVTDHRPKDLSREDEAID